MKLKSIATSLAVSAVLSVVGLAMPVSAASPGQLEGGSNVYEVKNATQGGSYTNVASANACDELIYSTMLHNTEFGNLSSIVVKADLPSGSSTSNTSTLTATTAAGGTTGTSDTATVNLSSAQSISYVSGSAKLYDGSGNLIENLPDGITNGGVNIGDLKGSTTEFVNFAAKVSCPTPPKPPVTPPAKPSAPAAPTQATPTQLVNTGPGDVIGAFSAVTLGGAVAYRLYLSRRLARQ